MPRRWVEVAAEEEAVEVGDEVEASGEAEVGVEEALAEEAGEAEASVEGEVEGLEVVEEVGVVRTPQTAPPHTVFLNIFFIFSRRRTLI